MNEMRLLIHKWTHWEYWPTWMVYFPIFFVWLYYCMRARTFYFFNAVNPTFENGGFANSSKKNIYDLIPSGYYPKTKLIDVAQKKTDITTLPEEFQWPVIVKPDKGLRGIQVKFISTAQELLEYDKNASFDYLIQEHIDYPYEAGIFYVRMPDQANGFISGIVQKEFLTVTGDGISRVEQLLELNPRHALQLATLRKKLSGELLKILPPGEQLTLVPYGSHNRGTLFVNAGYRINPQLTKSIDDLCRQVPGFYYGRLDIKFKSWEELEKGLSFSIIEINGAMSEPAHIYDPGASYIDGVKEISRHYRYMFDISKVNHARGCKYFSLWRGIQVLNTHFALISKLVKT